MLFHFCFVLREENDALSDLITGVDPKHLRFPSHNISNWRLLYPMLFIVLVLNIF